MNFFSDTDDPDIRLARRRQVFAVHDSHEYAEHESGNTAGRQLRRIKAWVWGPHMPQGKDKNLFTHIFIT